MKAAAPAESIEPSKPKPARKTPLQKVMEAYDLDSPERVLAGLLPRAYHVSTSPKNQSFDPGSRVTLIGKVVSEPKIVGGNKMKVVAAQVMFPGVGRIGLSWMAPGASAKRMVFGLSQSLKGGSEVIVSGKISYYNDRMQLEAPDVEPADPAILAAMQKSNGAYPIPVYPLKPKMKQLDVRRAVKEAYSLVGKDFAQSALPGGLESKMGLPPINYAYAQAHGLRAIRAQDAAAFASCEGASHKRLQVEGLWGVLEGLRKEAGERESAPVIDESVSDVISALPFPLTGDQSAAIEDILADLRSGKGARRLVQGDVGSGKSMVAFMSSIAAARAGHTVAVAAPTDILAAQLHAELAKMSADAGDKFPVIYVDGKSRAAEKRAARSLAEKGEGGIIVGTHAVANLPYSRLGLVVFDEEHRFGVAVKDKLLQYNPHLVTMSATPIPRSLASVAYAGYDVSVIREKPAGREPVRTKLFLPGESKDSLVNYMRTLADEGRQAFIVCPAIENEEGTSVNGVVERFSGYFGDAKVRGLHGQMDDEVIAETLKDFAAGKFPYLVSTTVIEVGINVPNSTLMVVIDPQRFGLAQLHQIRGRVGRGEYRGYCALSPLTRINADAVKRLDFFAGCNDGFELAAKDMELRGAGKLDGVEQSGFGDLNILALSREAEMINDYLDRHPPERVVPAPVAAEPQSLDDIMGLMNF